MTPPTPRPTSTNVLRASPRFRRLFLAQTISRWGDTFNNVALVIVVYRLTGSGLQVAGSIAFEVAPVILLGFVAGAVVDRFSRIRVMVAADLGRALVAATLVVGSHHIWAIYAAAFALAAQSVFFNPAAASIVPVIVGGEGVVAANSALWSAAVISQVALAPLAGALVAFAGAGPAFALNAVSFVVSAALLARLRVPAAPRGTGGRRLHSVVEGMALIRASHLLTTMVGVQALAALSAGATSALLVVLAERQLRLGAARFGWLLAAIGVGAGLGPVLFSRLVGDVRRPLWLFGPYVLRGAVDATLAGTTQFGVAAGALGVYGVGTSVGNVTYQSTLQRIVPDELRGRVFAFYDVVWQTSRLISIGAGGLLADRMGITAVYGIGALLLFAAGAVGLANGAALDREMRPPDLSPVES